MRRAPTLTGSAIALAVFPGLAVAVAVPVAFIWSLTPTSGPGHHGSGNVTAVAAHARVRGGLSLPAPAKCASCWRPPVRESWQVQLSSVPGAPFPRAGMIETDGFDTPASLAAALHRSHARAVAGRARSLLQFLLSAALSALASGR